MQHGRYYSRYLSNLIVSNLMFSDLIFSNLIFSDLIISNLYLFDQLYSNFFPQEYNFVYKPGNLYSAPAFTGKKFNRYCFESMINLIIIAELSKSIGTREQSSQKII